VFPGWEEQFIKKPNLAAKLFWGRRQRPEGGPAIPPGRPLSPSGRAPRIPRCIRDPMALRVNCFHMTRNEILDRSRSRTWIRRWTWMRAYKGRSLNLPFQPIPTPAVDPIRFGS
jgi:hypothetical protein